MARNFSMVGTTLLAMLTLNARADDRSGASTTLVSAAPGSVIDSDNSDPPARYFRRHAEGWFWYQDPIIEDDQPAVTPPQVQPEAPQALTESTDPEKAIASERHEMDVALDRALLQPTSENVKAYLVLNQKLMDQASAFAESWRGVVWTTPQLDHTVQSPVGPAAYLASNLVVESDEDRLADAAKQWGLLFFFRGNCPYCHQFAPLLKQFAERYGFHLVAISMDGGALPDFPNPQADAGAAAALGIDGVPALFVVNPATRRVAPAVFGWVSWSDLTQRVRYAIEHANDHQREAPEALAAAGH